MAVDIISKKPGIKEKLHQELRDKGYEVGQREYILITGHRRENFGEGFLHICKAIRELAALHPEMDIVYPVHLNPNVQKPVYELLSGVDNVYLISPLDYLPFIYAMQHSTLLLTDSGGVQEEASFTWQAGVGDAKYHGTSGSSRGGNCKTGGDGC